MVMYYAPHILERKCESTRPDRDEFGRVIEPSASERWHRLCECRCDHSGDKEIKTEDGTWVRPSRKIVCGENPHVRVNDTVRCVDADSGSVIAFGKVLDTRTTNYLGYAEIYL